MPVFIGAAGSQHKEAEGESAVKKPTEPVTFKTVIVEDRKKGGCWMQDRDLEWFSESICPV